MNPKQLHCFITAAQEGSFSKAAKKLYLSQQALSKTIDKLEEELWRSSAPVGLSLFTDA